MDRVKKPVWHPDGVREILEENYDTILSSINEEEDNISPSSYCQWIRDTVDTGFDPCFNGPEQEVISPEHRAGPEERRAMRKSIQAEVDCGRYVGPFPVSAPLPIPNTRAHPVFVRPKRESGAFRIISDYSHPHGNSVNDYLDPSIFPVSYVRWDEVLASVQRHWPHAHLGVADIEKAFRVLALSPQYYHLFALVFEQNVYYDTCGGFGGCPTPGAWNRFSRLIEHASRHRANLLTHAELKHYVDDFLGIASTAEERDILLYALIVVCGTLGVGIKFSKLDLGTAVQYLGMGIDGENFVVILDDLRRHELLSLVNSWRRRRRARVSEAWTLLGKLAFAGRALRSSRSFTRRMYAEVCRARNRTWFTPSAGFRKDLRWFSRRLEHYTGSSVIPDWAAPTEHCYTDASTSGGGGGLWRQHWFATDEWRGALDADLHIDEYELMAVAWACATFGPHWRRKTVQFHVDNEVVRGILLSRSSRSPRLMYWLRCIFALEEAYGFTSTSTRIPGVANVGADAVSRRQLMADWRQRLDSWRPDMDLQATPTVDPPSWSLLL